ncbi:spore coat protein [Neobacillus piezotolerans]|uniref:Spore coat protein n=1 Tax=Neobacillus piezotolerans TaxID=2259171 RepID=A0A3D8GPH8_9BACI|nr:CotD family spore coat protein [Neobacillus piezotolerans]RDU36393.1 spore coat protein [Neobacillus piezotolerans]
MYGKPGNPNPFIPAAPMHVNHVYSTIVIPHIHPVHGVTLNHQRIIHEHYFPHQFSTVQMPPVHSFRQARREGPWNSF